MSTSSTHRRRRWAVQCGLVGKGWEAQAGGESVSKSGSFEDTWDGRRSLGREIGEVREGGEAPTQTLGVPLATVFWTSS